MTRKTLLTLAILATMVVAVWLLNLALAPVRERLNEPRPAPQTGESAPQAPRSDTADKAIPKAADTIKIASYNTNTHRDRTYDNIILNRQATVEFAGRSGVLDLQGEYGLTEKDAMEVSDHLPVWAEFGVHESTAPGAVP